MLAPCPTCPAAANLPLPGSGGALARRLLPMLVVLPLTALPRCRLVLDPDVFLALPDSELPMKPWVQAELPPGPRPMGAFIDCASAPHGGVLNQPGAVGSLVFGALSRVLPPNLAWAGLLRLVLFANAASIHALTRQLGFSCAVSTLAGAAFGLPPFTLSYGAMSSITDRMHIWPFLAVTEGIGMPVALNPTRLLLHHLFPGGACLLEPFR